MKQKNLVLMVGGVGCGLGAAFLLGPLTAAVPLRTALTLNVATALGRV